MDQISVDLPNSKGVTSAFFSNVLGWVLAMGGVVAVAILVYGGVKFNTAQGQPDKVKQAQQIIAFGVVGLVVIILASAIAAFASGAFSDAAGQASTAS